MITVNKANPTPGEITSSLTGSTGDGAGLHFEAGGNIELTNSAAAEFGTSDFSLEFVLNQTGDNTNDNVIYYSHKTDDNRLYVFNDISDDTFKLAFVNAFGSTYTKALAYDMSVDYGTPTHYVVTCDRDGNATLYKNGNSVATVDISDQASVDIGASNTTSGYLGSWVSAYGVLGTFYRFRTWNKLLSSAEVQTAFERADVDWSDQHGSMTEKIGDANNRTFSGGSTNWSAVGITPAIDSGALKFPQTSAFAGGSNDLATFGNRGWLYKTYFNTGPSHTTGKRYRLTLDAKAETAGSKLFFNIQHGSTTPTNLNQSATLTTSFATYSFDVDSTHEYTASSDYILLGLDAAESYWIDNVSFVQIGCVSDYELSANPTQSLTVQDRSGAADGTTSASGVTQVQPIIQGNMRSLAVTTSQQAAGVPADGELIADSLKVGSGDVSPDGSPTLLVTDTSAGGSVIVRGKSPILAFDKTSSGTATILTDGGGLNVKDGTMDSHGDTHFAISSTGLATFSNGIAFSQTNTSATGATATGTTLDHYEEGTWTCTLNGVTGGSTTGIYTRIGNIVHFAFYSGSITSTAVLANFSGLPFSAVSGYYSVFTASHNTWVPNCDSGFIQNGTIGYFTASNSTSTATATAATGRYVMIAGAYRC